MGWLRDKWEWNIHKLNNLSEENLWSLYQKLNEPPPKPKYIVEIEKKIAEIEAIMEDGKKRNNKGQELSAKYEIEAVEETTLNRFEAAQQRARELDRLFILSMFIWLGLGIRSVG